MRYQYTILICNRWAIAGCRFACLACGPMSSRLTHLWPHKPVACLTEAMYASGLTGAGGGPKAFFSPSSPIAVESRFFNIDSRRAHARMHAHTHTHTHTHTQRRCQLREKARRCARQLTEKSTHPPPSRRRHHPHHRPPPPRAPAAPRSRTSEVLIFLALLVRKYKY